MSMYGKINFEFMIALTCQSSQNGNKFRKSCLTFSIRHELLVISCHMQTTDLLITTILAQA